MATDALTSTQGLDAATRHAAMVAGNAMAARKGYLILGVLAVTFVFIGAVNMLNSRAPTISLRDSLLTVHAAGYGADVSRHAFDIVRFTRQLSGLGAKRNGFQFGSAYAGRFEWKRAASQVHGRGRSCAS